MHNSANAVRQTILVDQLHSRRTLDCHSTESNAWKPLALEVDEKEHCSILVVIHMVKCRKNRAYFLKIGKQKITSIVVFQPLILVWAENLDIQIFRITSNLKPNVYICVYVKCDFSTQGFAGTMVVNTSVDQDPHWPYDLGADILLLAFLESEICRICLPWYLSWQQLL